MFSITLVQPQAFTPHPGACALYRKVASVQPAWYGTKFSFSNVRTP